MNRRHRRNEAIKLFWRDVYVAGGQVTFGIAAAVWFLPPFDRTKIIILLINGMITAMFIISGLITTKKL